MKLELSNTQRDQVLYYESGFEQLHPNLDIIDWMKDRGYLYHHDWRCYKQNHSFDKRSCYVLEFPDKEIYSLFILKWL